MCEVLEQPGPYLQGGTDRQEYQRSQPLSPRIELTKGQGVAAQHIFGEGVNDQNTQVQKSRTQHRGI